MISTRGRYALRVMIDIAQREDDGYITLDGIAKRQNISEKYLEGILASMTKAKLLCGLRGKGGGYKLVKRAEEYTVGEILRVTEGSLSSVACLKDGAVPCEKKDSCRTLPIWQGLNDVIYGYLDSITLDSLLDASASDPV